MLRNKNKKEKTNFKTKIGEGHGLSAPLKGRNLKRVPTTVTD